MFYDNHYAANREHLLDLHREAEQERLARQAAPAHYQRNRFYRPLLAQLGRQMHSLGQQLMDRYQIPEGRWSEALISE